MTDLKLIDNQSSHIAQLNEAFHEILETPIPGNAAARAERLTRMEEIATGYFQEAAATYERAWNVIFLIIETGLWREKLNDDGEPFNSYADYVAYYYESIGKYVSERTIHSRIGQFRTLGEIGVDAAIRTKVLENVPYLVGKLMRKLTDRDGKLQSMDAVSRKVVVDSIGLTGVGVTEMTDGEVMKEFIERLPDLDHKDAARVIARIIREWKHNYIWFGRKDQRLLVVRFFQVGARGKAEVRFKYTGGDLDHPEVQRWLKGMNQA